jgi:hypothetical protein
MLYPLRRKLSEGYFARRIVRVRSSDEGDQRFNINNYKTLCRENFLVLSDKSVKILFFSFKLTK